MAFESKRIRRNSDDRQKQFHAMWVTASPRFYRPRSLQRIAVMRRPRGDRLNLIDHELEANRATSDPPNGKSLGSRDLRKRRFASRLVVVRLTQNGGRAKTPHLTLSGLPGRGNDVTHPTGRAPRWREAACACNRWHLPHFQIARTLFARQSLSSKVKLVISSLRDSCLQI